VILFWAWVGWFPFQVYSTTFVGEVLKRYDTSYALTGSSDDKLGEIARVGSMALVLFSCVSLVASISLPWVIESPPSDALHNKPVPTSNGALARFLRWVEPRKPVLTSVWVWAHVSFAGLMFLTLFAASVGFATFLVALSGIAWALMTWAPFSIVGEEIQRLGGGGLSHRRPRLGQYEPVAVVDDDADVDAVEMTASAAPPPVDLESAAASSNELSGV